MFLRQFQITLGELFVLLGNAALGDCSHSLQARKRLGQFAVAGFRDRLPVFFDLLPFFERPGQRGILAADVRQLNRLQTGILFDGSQCIRSFDRSMLARVTGQDDAGVIILGERQ